MNIDLSLRGGCWWPLTSVAAKLRFARIMQLMDRRYDGLELGLQGWLDGSAHSGQRPELFGWSADGPEEPENLLQVIALTSRPSSEGAPEIVRVRMLGVAADRIPASDRRDSDIEAWLVRFLTFMQQRFGSELEFSAMRPKSMTFKPMERMHDFMRRGTTFDLFEGDVRSRYSATVIEERDRGHVLYWRVGIAPSHSF